MRKMPAKAYSTQMGMTNVHHVVDQHLKDGSDYPIPPLPDSPTETKQQIKPVALQDLADRLREPE
jgi:hypothetical protein